MRGLSLFCLFFVGWSLNLNELGLEHRGEVISAVFKSRDLLSFDPVKEAEKYKLQAFDPQQCGGAWLQLAGLLKFNASDPCTYITLVFRGVNDWSVGANAYFLNDFCATNMCLGRFEMAYNQMLGACQGFNPTFAKNVPIPGAGPNVTIGNQTDNIARTIRTLLRVACSNSSDAFQVPSFTHPLTQQTVPPTTIGNTFFWVRFAKLVQLNLAVPPADLQAALLDVCIDETRMIAMTLRDVGVNGLALAARTALSFCMNRTVAGAPVLCALKVQELQMKAADPAFATRLKAMAATDDDLASLCHPCVKWAMQSAVHIMQALQALNLGFNQTRYDGLRQSTDALLVSCDWDGKDYCVKKLAKYPIDKVKTDFTNACLGNGGCLKNPNGKLDTCYELLFNIYRDVQCCFASFVRSLSLPAVTSQFGPLGTVVGGIFTSCGLKPPQTCAWKKNRLMARLNNTRFDWIAKIKATAGKLEAIFASALGVDPMIVDPIQCWRQSDNSTVCNVTYSPNRNSDAGTFAADIAAGATDGTLALSEIDFADLSDDNGARLNTDLQAYDPSTFEADSVTVCPNASSPVSYSYDAANDTCNQLCMDGIQDQDETDVDCGGQGCVRCKVGQKCITDSDCDNSTDKRRFVCAKKGMLCAYNAAASLMASPLIVLIGLIAAFLL